MKCPLCQHELIKDGQAHLETLGEHVSCQEASLKDRYVCSYQYCATRKLDICWNGDGECYGIYSRQLAWIDNNNGPFGSFERKFNAESWNRKDDIRINLLFKWEVVFSFKKEADEDGKILKRTLKFRMVHDGVVYTPGIYLFFFNLYWYRRNVLNKSKEEYIKGCYSKAWWMTASNFIIKNFMPDR